MAILQITSGGGDDDDDDEKEEEEDDDDNFCHICHLVSIPYFLKTNTQ